MSAEQFVPGRSGVEAQQQEAAPSLHAVHFYEDESLFLESLSEYVGSALGAGGSCVLVATAEHCRIIEDTLAAFGIDVPYLTRSRRYLAFDAEETLDLFMRSGRPDEALFFQTFESIFCEARASLCRETLPVVAFGEMVALLYAENRYEAAFELERLWNAFAQRHRIALRCAYPISLFAKDGAASEYRALCGEHAAVIAAESFTRLNEAEDQWRLVSSLQQQASSLQTALQERREEAEQRKLVEERLRQTEEFARTIIESSVDCVKVLDLQGRIEFMNAPGWRAMEIENISDLLGQPWLEFWPESERPRVEVAIADAAAGAVGSFQAECGTFCGTTKSWDVKITPARNADGDVQRLIAVSRDITELRAAQTAALHAEKLATAGRMAATIAHEINNPLEAVTNCIYLAQLNENLSDEVRQYLEFADRELTRVAHIARQTLGFYRSNSIPTWQVIDDLVRDALTIYERRIRNKEISVEVRIQAGLKIFGKDGELRQALLNLTANAIDACRAGGTIWFRARRTCNWAKGEEGVRITVADNGSGMPHHVQKRIFVPFFTTKAEIGTGIGLWVTKCLIEQRGGFIGFRSRQGNKSGTVMSFFLPTNQSGNAATVTA